MGIAQDYITATTRQIRRSKALWPPLGDSNSTERGQPSNCYFFCANCWRWCCSHYGLKISQAVSYPYVLLWVFATTTTRPTVGRLHARRSKLCGIDCQDKRIIGTEPGRQTLICNPYTTVKYSPAQIRNQKSQNEHDHNLKRPSRRIPWTLLAQKKLPLNGFERTARLSRTAGILTFGNFSVSSCNRWSSCSPMLSLCLRRACSLTGLCFHLHHPPARCRRHPCSKQAAFSLFVRPARGRLLPAPPLDHPFPALFPGDCSSCRSWEAPRAEAEHKWSFSVRFPFHKDTHRCTTRPGAK